MIDTLMKHASEERTGLTQFGSNNWTLSIMDEFVSFKMVLHRQNKVFLYFIIKYTQQNVSYFSLVNDKIKIEFSLSISRRLRLDIKDFTS